MLHARLTVPAPLTGSVLELLRGERGVVDLAVLPGAVVAGPGDLVLFDVAREDADRLVDALRGLGLEREGSISLSAPLALVSRAADEAERAAPGHPDDGIVWNQVEEVAADDARTSWSFLVFLLLAILIAGVGRYLDQPILIIGGMVVGPDFAPLAALCVGVVRRKPLVARRAAATIAGGFAGTIAVAWVLWSVVGLLGLLDAHAATTGRQTDFIVHPDGWSFVVAVLAGVAGILSVTSSKSSALVGVFISITTVPAAATVALTLAVGAWPETGASAVQLVLNIAGLLLGGLAALAVQTALTSARRSARRALAERRAGSA